MAPKLIWDAAGARVYETGVDHGVLYPMDNVGAYPLGIVWNGLTAITESPSGAEANPFYADNIKYLNIVSIEEFAGSIEAYTYPTEFAVCDGSAAYAVGVFLGQQARKQFGLCYRSLIGNDIDGDNHGYLLHLVYGCFVTPSEKSRSSINESPEPIAFSWDFTTTPVPLSGYKPVAHIAIDSTKVDAGDLAALEVILYGVAGSPGTAARLPLPAEIITLMAP
jgi:hypothetical protein